MSLNAQRRLDDYGMVGITTEAPLGAKIRWVAAPYSEEVPGGVGVVRAGDIGTFMGFDGPDSNEAIVRLPAVGTFVLDSNAVEVAE